MLSLDKLKFCFALDARNNIALLPDNLIVQIVKFFLSNELRDCSLVDRRFAVLEETLEIAILVYEFLCNILDRTGLTEQMPAIFDVEETLHIKVRVELLVTLKALNNIGVDYG